MREFSFYGETWIWRNRTRYDYVMTIENNEVNVTRIKQSIRRKPILISFSQKDIVDAQRKRKIVRKWWFWLRIIVGIPLCLAGGVGIILILMALLDDYRPAIVVELKDGGKHIFYCDDKDTVNMVIAALKEQ